jgi:acyl-coenzyme A synthetase/AMP-(fatty) acid ligase/acyl carrier protein
LTLLQAATFSGSVSSMFAALLNGATLCPWDLRRSGLSGLARWIDDEGISVYHSVPSIFRAVASDEARFSSVRVIRLEGDQATHVDAEIFKRAFGSRCVLVNGLGATESGLVRQYGIGRGTAVQPGPLPIGYAAEDVSVSIADDGKLARPGEIGEIVVASSYLATGYWRRPDLTAAAFSSGADGVRRYRTGDLGRMGADGCVTLLGRKTLQHKILGRHVDLAAVEAALLRVPAVRHAAACTFEDDGTGAFLCGYVVADPGFDAAAVRLGLREFLPDWSIPSEIVALPALPLDTNGKVRRASLKRPDRSAASPRSTSRSRTPIEAAVTGLWESVLDRPGIDLDDDFFALGGSSLQAMRLVAAVEAALGAAIPVAAVFDRLRTIAMMAAHIQAARSNRKAGA